MTGEVLSNAEFLSNFRNRANVCNELVGLQRASPKFLQSRLQYDFKRRICQGFVVDYLTYSREYIQSRCGKKKTFIQHSEAQSSDNTGAPGAGGAENFVWIKTFCIPGSRLLNKS